MNIMQYKAMSQKVFSALQSDSHAYLILGAQRNINHIMQEAVARLLCENEQEAPCGHCESCRWYQAKSHPDFLHIEPDITPVKPVIRISQVRALQEEINKRAQKQRKVIWIDKGDTMNKQAQNACLKMLEEPPEDVIFLLTGQEAGFLPTVRSRCSIVRLGTQEDVDDEIPIEYFEKASAVLTAFVQNNILRAQALLTTDKQSFRNILPALILLVRECIAYKLNLPIISLKANEIVQNLVNRNILVNTPSNLQAYNQMLFYCLQQQKELKANTSVALCVDSLCIDMHSVCNQCQW